MRHPFLQETINDHLNCLWKINPSTSTHWLCAIVCVCDSVCVCVRNLYDLRQTIPRPIQKTTDHLEGGQFIGFGLITLTWSSLFPGLEQIKRSLHCLWIIGSPPIPTRCPTDRLNTPISRCFRNHVRDGVVTV